MRIILGGYFETALVRWIDEHLRPERNFTTHPYYMCVNRRVSKSYFDRAATFVALASHIVVPSVDWNLPSEQHENSSLSAQHLGIILNDDDNFGGSEWDEDTKIFANIIIQNGALSQECWAHVSAVDFRPLKFDSEDDTEGKKREIRNQVAHHYLCRLFLQIRATTAASAALVLSEHDIDVLREIGQFLFKNQLASPFDLPNLSEQVIDGENFAAGLLNFSPPDALALSAVKNDSVVKAYAARVSPFLLEASSPEAQRGLLAAMADAYARAEAGRKAEKIFEVAGWVVKPLHYVPGLGEALTLAEDVKDVISKWVDRETHDKEWYLIGVAMMDIAIADYLSRKGNQL